MGSLWGFMGFLWGYVTTPFLPLDGSSILRKIESKNIYFPFKDHTRFYLVSIGFSGVSMGFHGVLWASKGSLWVLWGLYGVQWGLYGFYGVKRRTAVYMSINC